MQNYFEDLWRLATIAHPDFSQDQLEADVQDHFIDGVKPYLKRFVLSLRLPDSIEQKMLHVLILMTTVRRHRCWLTRYQKLLLATNIVFLAVAHWL